MQPNYKLDEVNRHVIAELVKKCRELDLGNVSFSYYRAEVDFYLAEYKDHWGLTVNQKHQARDVYKIVGGEIVYQYTERP